ncbi:Der GTPase-activating protein YihI [Shewanella algae]
MSRSKKTRKVGENNPKLAPRTKKSERAPARKKQDSGNKAGSRQNPATPKGQKRAGSDKQDIRLGSKKPVALDIIKEKVAQPKLTDEQLLLQLEEDPRLNKLLDQLEEGRELAADDQQWLERQLAKIEKLMEKLGITDLDQADEAPSKGHSDDELLEKFESGAELLKQYQDN